MLTVKDSPPSGNRCHLCHVLATGVFPTLAVTDARCYGSAITISKKQLWNLFSLDKLVLTLLYILFYCKIKNM